jgi:hypothetical protein
MSRADPHESWHPKSDPPPFTQRIITGTAHLQIDLAKIYVTLPLLEQIYVPCFGRLRRIMSGVVDVVSRVCADYKSALVE